MTGPRINVAVVGAGIIGRNHAAAIVRHPRLRLAAVVDPDAAARRELAEPVAEDSAGDRPAEFDTLATALEDGDRDGIDLVAVCTPTGLHADLAEAALAADKHVLVEKPVEASLPRARRL